MFRVFMVVIGINNDQLNREIQKKSKVFKTLEWEYILVLVKN